MNKLNINFTVRMSLLILKLANEHGGYAFRALIGAMLEQGSEEI